MYRAGKKSFALIVMIASLLLASLVPASAQDADLDQQQRAALAAIPLITSDLPDGFRFVGEGYLTAGQAGGVGVDPAALTDAGFAGMYLSTYHNNATGAHIFSYASVWTDEAAAESGFALLEDETVTNPGADMTDTDLDAGSGSAELTTGTRDVDGTVRAVVDATFVIDRFVVGVSAETAQDEPMDASAMQALVETLESRANAVVEGQSPDGTDLSLPPSVLDIRPLGDEIQVGFLSASETETIYGVSGSSLSNITASWVSGVRTGDGDGPAVVIAASRFGDGETAARAVEQSADLVPLTIDPQPVDIVIEGADAVEGYQYVSLNSADGAVDSFRGVMQVGSTMVVVDVQGAASVEVAQAAVTNMLTAQVACSGGTCELPEVDLGA